MAKSRVLELLRLELVEGGNKDAGYVKELASQYKKEEQNLRSELKDQEMLDMNLASSLYQAEIELELTVLRLDIAVKTLEYAVRERVPGFAGHPIGSEELFGKNTLTPCATELSESENSHDVKTLPQIQRQFQAGLLQTKSGILESYSSWCKERFTRKRQSKVVQKFQQELEARCSVVRLQTSKYTSREVLRDHIEFLKRDKEQKTVVYSVLFDRKTECGMARHCAADQLHGLALRKEKELDARILVQISKLVAAYAIYEWEPPVLTLTPSTSTLTVAAELLGSTHLLDDAYFKKPPTQTSINRSPRVALDAVCWNISKHPSKKIESIMKRCIDLLTSNISQGKNLLHLACERGYEACAEWILLHGGDCLASDESGMLPLHYSASKGHLNVIQTLFAFRKKYFSAGSAAPRLKLLASSKSRGNVSHVKARRGAKLKKLFGGSGACWLVPRLDDCGLSVENAPDDHQPDASCALSTYYFINASLEGVPSSESLFSVKGRSGHSVLFTAVKFSQNKLVVWFGANGANKKAVDDEGRTLLHYAAREGNIPMIKLLLEPPFLLDVHQQNSAGKNAFVAALESKKLEAAQFLFDRGSWASREVISRLIARHKPGSGERCSIANMLLQCLLPAVESLQADSSGPTTPAKLHCAQDDNSFHLHRTIAQNCSSLLTSSPPGAKKTSKHKVIGGDSAEGFHQKGEETSCCASSLALQQGSDGDGESASNDEGFDSSDESDDSFSFPLSQADFQSGNEQEPPLESGNCIRRQCSPEVRRGLNEEANSVTPHRVRVAKNPLGFEKKKRGHHFFPSTQGLKDARVSTSRDSLENLTPKNLVRFSRFSKASSDKHFVIPFAHTLLLSASPASTLEKENKGFKSKKKFSGGGKNLGIGIAVADDAAQRRKRGERMGRPAEKQPSKHQAIFI